MFLRQQGVSNVLVRGAKPTQHLQTRLHPLTMPLMSMKHIVVPLVVPLMVPLMVLIPYMFSVSVFLRRIYDARCSYGTSTSDVDSCGTSYGTSMLMVPPIVPQ